MADDPCNNAQCPSYGTPHPNCRCYAHGGPVSHTPECHHFAEGGPVHPGHAAGHAAVQHGLSGLLGKIGRSAKIAPEQHGQNYLASASKGHDRLHKHSKSVLGREKTDPPETRPRKELEDHLARIKANPQAMLDVGGTLGENLPDHGAHLAVLAARSVEYLESIRPKPNQTAPMDRIQKVTPQAQRGFDRQLDIAESPLLLLRHVKSGTLRQQDLTTVATLYPELLKSMTAKMMDRVLEGKGKRLPLGQQRSLSLLLGSPLSSLQTPAAMQSIMAANSGSSKEQTQGPKKASGVELKQVDKMAKILGTRSQDKELPK